MQDWQEQRVTTTRVESIEDIRRASKAARTPTMVERHSNESVGSENDSTRRFRPTFRPPMALICVLDDGRDDGQWYRIYQDAFVVGRSQGDLTLPHETKISGRHFELRRSLEEGRFRWSIHDLESTHGTFVRVNEAILRDRQQVLIGYHRYCLEIPAETPAAQAAQAQEEMPTRDVTQQWRIPAAIHSASPTFAEIPDDDKEPKRHSLNGTEHWIGSDQARTSIAIDDDPYVSPRHAKLYKDERGQWRIKNEQSLNGTWVRIKELRIEKSVSVQAGEQRFLIAIP